MKEAGYDESNGQHELHFVFCMGCFWFSDVKDDKLSAPIEPITMRWTQDATSVSVAFDSCVLTQVAEFQPYCDPARDPAMYDALIARANTGPLHTVVVAP